MDIRFTSQDKQERHACEARRENDVIIFTCPNCPGYERRMNMRTGQVKTQQGSDPWVLHEGKFVAPGLDATVTTAN